MVHHQTLSSVCVFSPTLFIPKHLVSTMVEPVSSKQSTPSTSSAAKRQAHMSAAGKNTLRAASKRQANTSSSQQKQKELGVGPAPHQSRRGSQSHASKTRQYVVKPVKIPSDPIIQQNRNPSAVAGPKGNLSFEGELRCVVKVESAGYSVTSPAETPEPPCNCR